jgi:bifunctional non-homologous end joining protein LigD
VRRSRRWCLNRDEFVVVGWTDPERSRPRLGALLLAYYDPDNRLVYAGRAGPASIMPNLTPVAPPPATGHSPDAAGHPATGSARGSS